MVTDRVSDMLTRIKNAAAVGKDQVVIDFSKLNFAIAEVLKQEGYLKDVSRKNRFNKKGLCLTIAYNEKGKPLFTNMVKVSKPSLRIYKKADEIHAVRQGRGVAIISTPAGVVTDKKARKDRIGGEVMCKVW